MSGPGREARRGDLLPGAFYWSDALADRLLARPGPPPPGRERLWFVIYDIGDPGRLRRVARCCENHGLRIQYSVFAVLADRPALLELREQLAGLIDEDEDDVRFYRIAARHPIHHVGRPLQSADLVPAHPMMHQLRLALG